MTAIADGDQAAFAELYDEFAPRLLGLIARILGRREEAEDVLPEVFREVWSAAGRFDPALSSLDFWLLMLARARAIDHLRSNGAAVTWRHEGEPAPAVETAELTDRSELAVRAREALALLPEAQREAIALAFFHGWTGRQIAERRGIPLGTVKTRIRSGMRKLREHLGGQQTLGSP